MVFLFLLYLPQFGYKQAIKGNSLFSDLLPRKNFENVVNAPSSECAASPKLSSYRGHNNSKYFKHVSLCSDLKQIHMYVWAYIFSKNWKKACVKYVFVLTCILSIILYNQYSSKNWGYENLYTLVFFVYAVTVLESK